MHKQTVTIRCDLSTLQKIHSALNIALRAKGFWPELPVDHDEAEEKEYQASMRRTVREGEALAFDLFYAGAEQVDPSGHLALGF